MVLSGGLPLIAKVTSAVIPSNFKCSEASRSALTQTGRRGIDDEYKPAGEREARAHCVAGISNSCVPELFVL